MKLIIQCAGRKFDDTGRLTSPAGEKVLFAAHPERYTGSGKCERPDDFRATTGQTWREYLLDYNRAGKNPDRLYKAGALYQPPIYKRLTDQYGDENVFILSAGWGLVRADFYLPYYNITFSTQADPYCQRKVRDEFRDFNQLAEANLQANEPIYFFGGQSYLPLYLRLMRDIKTRKVIYHSFGEGYLIDGYECIPYRGFTNWHYVCAQDFIDGRIRN
jgi:hypothetical protein